MTTRPENSMAAVLSTVMSVVIWLAVIFGTLFFILIGMGLAASLNGGEMAIPGGDVYAEDMPAGQLVGALAALAVMLPGLVYICIQLRRILSTLAAGDPFVPENAPRLSRIAIALAIMELARYATVLILRASFDLGGDLRLAPSLAAWASVVALLVLSQVFREGTRLREDQKMTI